MRTLRRLAAQAPTLVLARRNLSRASARTALAIVAIVIGVVAIGTIGAGGEAFKQDQLSAYDGFAGTATVSPVFYPSEDEGASDAAFSEAEITRMRQATDGATIVPVARPTGTYGRSPSGELLITAQVKATTNPGAFYEAQSGEIPENWDRSLVVGSRVATTNDIEPGDQLTVSLGEDRGEQQFRVAAVLEAQGFADPLTADQSVFIPLSALEEPAYDDAIVRVDPQVGSVSTAAENIETEFNTRRREVYVQEIQEQRDQFEQLFATINQFLIGVGAISLLVAAVTIANTMLMTAIEREGEIGVMRAVGYPKGAVMRLMVAEAAILGIVGAAIGVPLVLALTAGINQFLLGDPFAFTAAGFRYIAVGAVFGIVTSLLAGIYPAWKAANKRPVEALG